MTRPERVSRTTVYTSPWLTLFEDEIVRGDQPGRYAVVERADSVVLLVRSERDRLLFVHTYRYPTGELSLELPMGGIDPGEEPVAAALRELAEETALTLRSGNLRHHGVFRGCPGLTPQSVWVYSAAVDDALLDSATTRHSGDDLEGTRVVALSEVPALIAAGRITDSFTLSSLALSGWAFPPRPDDLGPGTMSGHRP